MTTETTAAPTESSSQRSWFEPVPHDWPTWLAFLTQVNASREARRSLRNFMAGHLDPAQDALKLGLGLYAAGRAEEALVHLEGRGEDLARLVAGHAHRQLRQDEQAAAIWEGLASSSLAVPALRALASLQGDHRDTDGLEKTLASLKSAGTSEAEIAYLEGLLAEAVGDAVTAVERLNTAVEADETHSEATFRLARLFDLHGEDDEAMDLYERFRDGRLPPHVGALINLAILYEDAEEHDQAWSLFQAVSDADPTNTRARRYLDEAEASMNQFYDESRERKADKQNAVLRIPVTDFELSVRARNCLQRMNIHTLGDLVCRTESELLSFKNFGETSLQEVKDILGMKGLRLGMMPGEAPSPLGKESTLVRAAPEGDVNQIKISDLDLSVRSRAALATLGIITVGDLVQTNETTLLSCKNFGQTSLDEIKSKLRSLNLSLAR